MGNLRGPADGVIADSSRPGGFRPLGNANVGCGHRRQRRQARSCRVDHRQWVRWVSTRAISGIQSMDKQSRRRGASERLQKDVVPLLALVSHWSAPVLGAASPVGQGWGRPWRPHGAALVPCACVLASRLQDLSNAGGLSPGWLVGYLRLHMTSANDCGLRRLRTYYPDR